VRAARAAEAVEAKTPAPAEAGRKREGDATSSYSEAVAAAAAAASPRAGNVTLPRILVFVIILVLFFVFLVGRRKNAADARGARAVSTVAKLGPRAHTRGRAHSSVGTSGLCGGVVGGAVKEAPETVRARHGGLRSDSTSESAC
jgi:hypothetical protein